MFNFFCKKYPFLDEKKGLKACWKNRKKYLTAQFAGYYDKIELKLHAKAEIFNHIWLEKQEKAVKVFTNAFNASYFKKLFVEQFKQAVNKYF